MNILMYVMIMLMLLASLTYAKLEMFRNLASMESGFFHYMAFSERESLNRAANECYDSIRVRTHSGEKTEKNPSSSRLSFYVFLNKSYRDQNLEAYHQMRELAKQLMTYLYQDQPFFKEISEKRPQFLNEILDQIEGAAESQLESQTLRNATALSKLEFADRELQYIFYLMLHGFPRPANIPVRPIESQSDKESTEDTDDETAALQESSEATAAIGYTSLLDYISVAKTAKLRVFLASRPLLMAIYGDDSIVDHLMEMRIDLYRQVQNGFNVEEATMQFQNDFAHSGNAQSYAAILDFAVTKTDPRKYDRAARQ